MIRLLPIIMIIGVVSCQYGDNLQLESDEVPTLYDAAPAVDAMVIPIDAKSPSDATSQAPDAAPAPAPGLNCRIVFVSGSPNL